MIGGIIKSTEALRFHAKSAEIAGQNLAHVNDESYARQRVLSREGLMSKGQGGLNTSSIESDGLDQARNELLDKRVFSEFGESASIEAQVEVLNLLQAALGESVNRSGVDGGLDLEHNSNLAEGGLARALDDLFNAFQELSASPDESNAKQEIFQKIQTLTKRFNDAGSAIEEIETDLSNTVEASVSEVNQILNKIYEVNLQIKRFELLDQGKAVTYRDNRQGLLEDLSKFMNFRIQPEISDLTGDETGFWNLSALGADGQDIELVSSANGVKQVSKDFGKILQLENSLGGDAQIRAKIAGDGSLGHIEVLDGGSQYNDTDGPILVSFAPSQNDLDNGDGLATATHNKGEVFRQNGVLYQALQNTLVGASLEDPVNFLSISELPKNGEAFPESLRRYSDLDNFEKGDLVFYEGKLYQASDSFGPSAELKVGGESSTVLQRDIAKGEVLKFNDTYFQALKSIKTGSEINGIDTGNFEIGQIVDGNLLSLGSVPPKIVEDLSYMIQTLTTGGEDRWFLGKSYQQGDLVKFEDKYFEATEDVYRETEIAELATVLQRETPYAVGDVFGKFKSIENPSPDFLEENGSLYLNNNKREFTISSFVGSAQTKQVKIENISPLFEFDVSVNGESIKLAASQPGTLSEQLLAIKNSDGQQVFDVVTDATSTTVTGFLGNSDDFQIVDETPVDKSTIIVERNYFADQFSFSINEKGTKFTDGENLPTPASINFDVDFKGTPFKTAQAIVDKIKTDPDLSKIISAEVVNGSVQIVSLQEVGTDYDLELLQGTADLHNETNNILNLLPQEKSVLQVSPPDVVQNVAEELIVDGFLGTSSLPIKYDLSVDDNIQDFTLDINGVTKLIEVDQTLTGVDRLEDIKAKLLEIENDGTQIVGTPALNPALDVLLDNANETVSIAGIDTTINYSITSDSASGLFKTSVDRYELEFNGEKIIIESQGTEEETVNSIANAINGNATMSASITASSVLDENQSWNLKLLANQPGQSIKDQVSVKFYDYNIDQASQNAAGALIVSKGINEQIGLGTMKVQSIDFKKSISTDAMTDSLIRFKQNEIYYQADPTSPSGFSHFVVTAPIDIKVDDIAEFNPSSDQWKSNFQQFQAELLDPVDPSTIIRKAYPTGHNLDNGLLVELNVGLGEAVVKGGQIVGFNILNSGNGLPMTDSIFVDGNQLELESGSIKGYQNARSMDVENYRVRLNELVSTFVEEINEVYNPDDQPGSYLFGFDAILTRPVTGKNLLMEEEFGYKGREGDAFIKLYRDEVDMSLPFAASEEFSIVNTTPIYSEDFRGVETVDLYRGGDIAETTFRADNAGDLFSFYGSASKMNFVTMENDDSYPGADLSPGTEDDGRSMMMAYESIPFRIEGLEEGSKLPIIGDNFIFSALPANPWNLASSLKVDRRLSADSLLAGDAGVSGSNEIAQAISELGDGTFIDKVASLNSEIGTGLGDLNDNLEHQKSIETLLLDQRRAVSSVSVDEEVADLMRYQRSFQASSRVLTTLDKMLEIVVMGLIR